MARRPLSGTARGLVGGGPGGPGARGAARTEPRRKGAGGRLLGELAGPAGDSSLTREQGDRLELSRRVQGADIATVAGVSSQRGDAQFENRRIR